MPAHLLYLVADDSDVATLSRRVRPCLDTLVKVVHLGHLYPPGHALEGLPKAVTELEHYHADVVIFNEHAAHASEIEAILENVLRPAAE